MFASKRVQLKDLNPHIMCVLCGGYLIQATTVIECLHSFCKSCILNFLETSDVCPICDVQVHKTWPLLNIRLDQTLQSLVYKLVPGLFQDEMRRRREYHWTVSDSYVKTLNLEERGDAVMEKELTPGSDQISLVLQMVAREDESGALQVVDRRYLLCPLEVTIAHLKKFVRMKFALTADNKIVIYKSKEEVTDDLMLQDVAIIYSWKREEPMNLFYTVARNPFLTKSWSSKTKSSVLASVSTAIGTFLAREDSPVTSVSTTDPLPKVSPSVETAKRSDKAIAGEKTKHSLSSTEKAAITPSSTLASSSSTTFLSSSRESSFTNTTVISSKCLVSSPSLPPPSISSSHKRSTPLTPSSSSSSPSSSRSSSILSTSISNSTSSTSPLVLQTNVSSSTTSGAKPTGASSATQINTLSSPSKPMPHLDNGKEEKNKRASKGKRKADTSKSVVVVSTTLSSQSPKSDTGSVKHHCKMNSTISSAPVTLSSNTFLTPTPTGSSLSSSHFPRLSALSSTTTKTTTTTVVPVSTDGCNTVNVGNIPKTTVIQPKVVQKLPTKASPSTYSEQSLKVQPTSPTIKPHPPKNPLTPAKGPQAYQVSNAGKPNSANTLVKNPSQGDKQSPTNIGQINTVDITNQTNVRKMNGPVASHKSHKKSSHPSVPIVPTDSSKSTASDMNRTVVSTDIKNSFVNPARQVKSTMSMPSASKSSLNSMKIIHSVESILSQTPKQDCGKTHSAKEHPLNVGQTKETGKKLSRVEMTSKEIGKEETQNLLASSKKATSNTTTNNNSKVVAFHGDAAAVDKQKYPHSKAQAPAAFNSQQKSMGGKSVSAKLSSEEKNIVTEIKHYYSGHENKHTTLKNKFDFHNVPSYNVTKSPNKASVPAEVFNDKKEGAISSHIPTSPSAKSQTTPVLYKSISCDESQTRNTGVSSLEKRNWKKRKLSEIDQELSSSTPQTPPRPDWSNKRQCVTPDASATSKFGSDNTTNERSNTNIKSGIIHTTNSTYLFSSPSLSMSTFHSPLKQERENNNHRHHQQHHHHHHSSSQASSSFTPPLRSPAIPSVQCAPSSRPSTSVASVNTAQRNNPFPPQSNSNSLPAPHRSPVPCSYSQPSGKRGPTVSCNHDSNNNMNSNHAKHSKNSHNNNNNNNNNNNKNNNNNSTATKPSESNSSIYSNVFVDSNSMKSSVSSDRRPVYEASSSYNPAAKKQKVEDICIDVNGGNVLSESSSSSSSSSQTSPSSTITSPRSSLTSPGTDATSPGTEDRPDTVSLPECRASCEGTAYAIASILNAPSKPSPLDLTSRPKKS